MFHGVFVLGNNIDILKYIPNVNYFFLNRKVKLYLYAYVKKKPNKFLKTNKKKKIKNNDQNICNLN